MRYDSSSIILTDKVRYYKSKIYPNIPLDSSDVYIICGRGDRLDLISYQYYNDSAFWWVISICNPHIKQGSMFITPGTQIRVVPDLSRILTLFEELNK